MNCIVICRKDAGYSVLIKPDNLDASEKEILEFNEVEIKKANNKMFVSFECSDFDDFETLQVKGPLANLYAEHIYNTLTWIRNYQKPEYHNQWLSKCHMVMVRNMNSTLRFQESGDFIVNVNPKITDIIIDSKDGTAILCCTNKSNNLFMVDYNGFDKGVAIESFRLTRYHRDGYYLDNRQLQSLLIPFQVVINKTDKDEIERVIAEVKNVSSNKKLTDSGLFPVI